MLCFACEDPIAEDAEMITVIREESVTTSRLQGMVHSHERRETLRLTMCSVDCALKLLQSEKDAEQAVAAPAAE